MNHIKEIAARLQQYGLDGMLITSAPGERYAVGFHGEGVVLVTAGKSFYYTDGRYIEAAATAITGAEVGLLTKGKGYSHMVEQAVKECGIQHVGFEADTMTVRQYDVYHKNGSAEMIPADALLAELRASKSEEEAGYIRQAQKIAEYAFQDILGVIRPGMAEREVAARLQYQMLLRGAEAMAFDTIVVSGPNGSLPHGVPGDRAIQTGDFVTMDFGCIYKGYCSDMTRTIAVGAPSSEMSRVYETVLQAQLAGIAVAGVGVSGAQLHTAAHDVIASGGYGDYFTHSFGHGVGLEIHEAPGVGPRSTTPLPQGAVITAEPGIYLPGRFGVRIEDMLYLGQTGVKNLTAAEKTLIIL